MLVKIASKSVLMLKFHWFLNGGGLALKWIPVLKMSICLVFSNLPIQFDPWFCDGFLDSEVSCLSEDKIYANQSLRV